MTLDKHFRRSYDEFVAAWLHHEDLRHGGSITDRALSRARLDQLRYEVASMARSVRV